MVPNPILQTGHVGLNVSDLQRSKAFYQDVFGLAVQGESAEPGRSYVFLKDAARLVLTLWQQSAGVFPKDRPGLHHLSFQVGSVDEVAEHAERARSRGARMLYEGMVAHSEGASSGGAFFEDPDGIRLEVYCPEGMHDHQAPSGSAPSCGFF